MYDKGNYPNMMVFTTPQEKHVFRDVVDEIFSHKNKEKALNTIERYGSVTQHPSLWTHIIGTRLKVGRKAITAEAKFDELFSME